MIFISFFLKKKTFVILGFCVLFLALGIVRLQITEFNIENDKLRKLNDLPGKITLSGQIIGEPDIRDSYQKLKVKVDGLDSIVLITVGRYITVNYLDKVKITGKLKTPEVFNNFNYKNYLLKDKIYSVMDFPKIELVSKEHDYNVFTFLYEKILFFKEKLSKSVNSNFSEPQNLILEGIVFGNDKNMPKYLKDKFNTTGLSHLTAVSGGNIVILIFILTSFLLFLGFWRNQVIYISLTFVWFYILLVGLSASSVRAAIMGSIFLLAQKLGRQNTSSRTIVLAAAFMLLENPLLLFYDVGFQLSFLASMGIIHLKPLLDSGFTLIKNYIINLAAARFTIYSIDKKSKSKYFFAKKSKELRDIISVTLSAQIFTLPVLIYYFSTLSIVAPVTNILILPAVPFIMSFGFLSALLGIFSNFLGWVLALPCYFLLFYFLKVLDIFHQPWAMAGLPNVSWLWVLFYYIGLGILIWFWQRKQKPDMLK